MKKSLQKKRMSSSWIIGLLLASCAGSGTQHGDEAAGDAVARSYSKDKKLVSEVSMKDGKRNGEGKVYYPSGKVNLALQYVNDKREGKISQYYETGILYSKTDYVNDQMHGKLTKFGSDGSVLSEAPFEFNEPCMGLVEFVKGTKREDYPSIHIKVINQLEVIGAYTIRLTVTEGASSVTFYEGKLTESGCLNNELIPLAKGKARNTGELKYELSPGQSMKKELNFVAVVITRSGNTYLAQKTFPLSIKN